MANKIQIKKFLEGKKYEAIRKLNESSEKEQEIATNNFYTAYKPNFNLIITHLEDIHNEYKALMNTLTGLSLVEFSKRYSGPSHVFNQLESDLNENSLRKYFLVITEAQKIKAHYETKINETEREYNNLIAICQARPAAESLKALEEIGFNISEIEVKPEECTALLTSIDATKLFV
jgi:hypothetical protein